MRKLPEGHPLRRMAARDKKHRSGLKALLSFVLPASWALLGVFTPELWKEHGTLALIAWFALLIIHGIVWWNVDTDESAALSLTIENDDLAVEKEDLLSTLNDAGKWVFHSYAALNLRAMTTEFIRDGIVDRSQFEEAAGDMLAPLYLNGGDVLGFDASERWTFGIFLYSIKRDELVPVWREKSRNHPSAGRGRSWGRGQGHVGKCFVDKKPIITGDAMHPDVIQLCGAPAGMEKDYDGEVYRSFASIPIPSMKADALPYGVLIGTSDKKDRFDQDGAILLMHYAEALAAVIGLGKIDIDCILAGPPPHSGERENQDEAK